MSNSPASNPPPPTSSNRTYAVIALLLLLGVGLLAWFKFKGQPEEIHTEPPKPAPAPTFHQQEDEIPPPPDPAPEPEAVDAAAPTRVSGPVNSCSARACSADEVQALSLALRQRGNQARKCYDSQLVNDPTLKVNMTINVKVGTQGGVCGASVKSSSHDAVGRCVLNYVQRGGYPGGKGCVADLNVPFNFVPR